MGMRQLTPSHATVCTSSHDRDPKGQSEQRAERAKTSAALVSAALKSAQYRLSSPQAKSQSLNLKPSPKAATLVLPKAATWVLPKAVTLVLPKAATLVLNPKIPTLVLKLQPSSLTCLSEEFRV